MLVRHALSLLAAILLAAAVVNVEAASYGTSDCLMENCSPIQSGYLDGYNFDPSVVGSSSFGILWNSNPSGKPNGDQFLAQSITYTPPNGIQVVIVMSEMNNIYVLDSATGAVKNSITLNVPFTAQDAQCADITPTIGVTGTPVLDANTGTIYFWSKGYADPTGKTTGLDNGRYRFYGLDAITLKQKFEPVDIQGLAAGNRPSQAFEGGKQLQRTGLLLANGVVYAGFGGHCDNFNYTGWVIGMDANTGSNVNSFSTQAGAFASIGSGIWQAGGGISYDSSQGVMWLVTGNGAGQELGSTPRIGRNPPGTLPMSVFKLAIDSSSKNLSVVDFFTPSDYKAIDAADQDFGSSGVAILPTGFSAGNVKRLAIANGKNSKAYVMNADALGGYKTGNGGGDGNLQTIPLNGQSFSTSGAYPLEGGYVYISSTGSPTIALKFNVDASGNPSFSLVGQTADSSTGTRGVGHTTVTSNAGQAGSGILWITDIANGNLRAYAAIPPANGTMNSIFSGVLPAGGAKYQRAVPGNGRMFVVSTSGTVTAFGSPVNQPFNCNTSLAFGDIVIGKPITLPITCQALISTSITNASLSDATTFKMASFPALNSKYKAQSSPFTFNVTWTPAKVGPVAATLTISTTNDQAGYVNTVPIVLRGTGVSSGPSFNLVPSNIAFGGLVPGASDSIGGVNLSVSLGNLGLQDMHILSWDFDEFYVDTSAGDDDYDDDNSPVADTDGKFDKKTTTGNFTLFNMPTMIKNQSTISLSLNFNPTINGDYKSNLTIYTDGGNSSVLLTGSANGPAVMTISTQQYDGSYMNNVSYMDFGDMLAGQTKTLLLKVTNQGGSALTITKSKPPTGPLIFALNPTTDLTEGDVINANTTDQAAVQLSSQVVQINIPAYNTSSSWVLNGNDPNFGVHFIQMSGRIVTPQVGPKLAIAAPGDINGTSRYSYLGCYIDTGNPRTFPTTLTTTPSTFENGACQSAGLALDGGGNFVGSEYASECYASSQPPSSSLLTPDYNCQMACSGDPTQTCGGQFGYMSVFYDTLAYNATSSTFLPGAYQGPQTVQNVTTPSGTQYNYAGCIADAGGARSLSSDQYVDQSGMTVESCAAYCSKSSYLYAGVEYAQECYCGNTLPSDATFNQTGCTMTCSGSKAEYCGGPSRLNLYKLSGNSTVKPTTTTTSAALSTSTVLTSATTSTSESTSTANPTSATTTTTATSSTTASPTSTSPASTPTSSANGDYKGCYSEPNGARALPTMLSSSASQSVESCTMACYNAGWSVAGLEYGQECWCGNALSSGSSLQSDSTCTMPCTGNSSEICGGSNLLNVYSKLASVFPSQPASVGSYISQGCWTDNTGARTLQGKVPNLGNNNTIEGCAFACSSFQYFGVEYGSECYCGNQILNNAVQSEASKCNMQCSGNATEYCGAGNQLGLYKLSIASSSSTTSPLSTSTTASATISTTLTSSTSLSSATSKPASTTSSPTLSTSTFLSTVTTASPITTTTAMTTSTATTPSSISTTTSTSSSSAPSATGFVNQGCYPDNGASRSLSFTAYQGNNSNSASNCALYCRGIGYRFSGVEYGTECYCDNYLLNQAASSGSGATGCSTACPANSSETCGGSNRINVAKDLTWSQKFFTVQQTSQWNFTDCYVDDPGKRILNVTLAQGNNKNTVESCLSSCAAMKLNYCGVEYGSECFGSVFLDSTSPVAPSSGSSDPLSRGCSMPCAGNSTIACGGASRINVYTFNPNQTNVSPSLLQKAAAA